MTHWLIQKLLPVYRAPPLPLLEPMRELLGVLLPEGGSLVPMRIPSFYACVWSDPLFMRFDVFCARERRRFVRCGSFFNTVYTLGFVFYESW